MTIDTENSSSGPTPPIASGPRVLTFLGSPAVKFVLIGVLTVLLLIPSLFVWVLVEERADRARDVARDIASSWGGTQAVNGPYLVIPFTETYTVEEKEGGRTVTRTRVVKREAVLFPETLEINGDVSVEERQKSIYSLPAYLSRLKLTGRFAAPSDEDFRPNTANGRIDLQPENAALVVGIGDIRALKSAVTLKLDGVRSVPFEPGLASLKSSGALNMQTGAVLSGINAAVPALNWRKGFSYDVSLRLNGSTGLFVAPAGQTTKVALASDWPHPGFSGAFLPEKRTITETGFEASWTIPYLARGIPKLVETDTIPLNDKLLGVKFVEPVNFYQTISRSMKYAVGFISLTFLAVFVLEMRSGWSFHWVQYALVGFSLIIFYVMLLAFAEHVGYGPAYLIAAGAASLLNAVYVGTSLRSRAAGLIMLTVLGSIFGLLFALMREQDYALLIGSVIAFAALGVVMFVTQNIDWSGKRQQAA